MDLITSNPKFNPVVTVSPHPLLPGKDRELLYDPFYPGETIGQYIERHGLSRKYGLDGRRPVVCTIQDRRVPFALWPHIRPKPGTIVQFHAVVRGSGDGNKVGRTIGTILVAAAAYWVGGAVGASYGKFIGAVASGATAVIGGMVVNELFPPPKSHLPQLGDDSPTYSVAGGTNEMRRYEPMPKFLGTHRVFPDFGAQPYTEYQGEDQYAFYVFDFGYNDIDISDMRLGDTPLENFTGVEYEISNLSGVLNLFPTNVDTVGGEELTQAVSWVQRTTAIDTTQIAVEISGLLFQLDSRGDIRDHLVTIEVNYRKVGDTTWLPVAMRDDSLPAVLQNLIAAGGLPALISASVREWIQQQGLPNGQINIWNGNRKPLRRTYSWHVPKGQYEVRVRRISADSTSDKQISEIIWSQLRSYQPDTTSYVGRKRMAMKVRASGQIAGSLPPFNCIVSAKTVVWGGGSALDLNNGNLVAGQGAQVAHDDSLSTQSVTVVLWFKLTGPLNVDGNNNWRSLIRKGTPSSSVSGWDVVLEQSGSINWDTGHGTTDRQAGAIAATIGELMHLAFTYDAESGAKKVYKNGVPIASKVAPAGGLIANTTDLFIGYGTNHVTNPVGSGDTPGQFDGVRVYGRALSDQEVAEHYNNGLYKDNTGLVGWWEFDEGAGVDVTDKSGHGNDATLLGGALWVSGESTVPRGGISTSNPGWWYLDALRGRLLNGRRIWGANASESLIDLETIKLFAEWCDAQNPPLTINAVLDQQMSVFDVLSAIALMGRGTPSWATGKLGVVWDAPDLPITAVFGMHNIVAGSFEIEYATEDVADVIEGEFINPELDWQRDYIRVVVPGATTQANVRRIQLFGRTDKVLAAQDTNLYAATNAYRNRRYKWTSDWEAMPCARGDVVQLSHDLASLDYSGRFVEGTTDDTLKLPRNVPLYAGGAFIVIIKPDGSYATYAVQGGTGETDTLTPVSTLPFDISADTDNTPYDYRWLYGPTATPGKKVKIDHFRPIDERQVEIMAVDELPIFYTAKDNPYTYVPPTPIFGVTPQIQSITLTPNGVRAGKGYVVDVTIDWEILGRFSVCDVRIAIGEGPLLSHATNLKSTTTRITIEDRQTVTVEVTAYSDLGRLGSKATLTKTEFIDFTSLRVPSDVPEFTVAGNVFTWEPAPEADVVGYQLRFHIGYKLTWSDALPLHEGLITEHDWEAAALPLDDDVVVFLIKAVDAAGQTSENPALVIKGLGDATLANVLEVVDQRDLGWPGTITGGSVVGDAVEADDNVLFYSANDLDTFYSANDSDVFYPAAEYDELTYETSVIAPTAPLFGSVITVQHVLQGDPHYVYWRQDGLGELYSLNDADPFYTSDTDPLYTVGAYIPWTGARVVEPGDRYQFKLVAAASAIQGIFSEFLVSIDAPDKEEELSNVVISPSGTRLPITKDFTSIKSVQGTLEDDGSDAVTFEIVDRDPDLGPLIRALDASKVATTGRGDFRVKGW